MMVKGLIMALIKLMDDLINYRGEVDRDSFVNEQYLTVKLDEVLNKMDGMTSFDDVT